MTWYLVKHGDNFISLPLHLQINHPDNIR